MPLQYVNRKGQKYFLHVGVTKTGKPKYYLAQNAIGPLLEGMPPGFEIYENPNGQVVLRKSLPKLILDVEMETVERAAERFAALKDCRLDRKLTVLTVYAVDQPADLFEEITALALRNGRTNLDELLNRFRSYSPQLQFVLVDAEKRIFQTQRFCYLGSIDDWIDIGTPSTLALLSQKYLRHIGQDSYYELF